MAGSPLRVLAIVGSTGTGKTELAMALARRTGAEIVGADSMQVYRYMDIGTAKPAPALRAEIPHHAIDIVDPDEPMSAGGFAVHARAAASEIAARGRPVVLCGGSGLYARAFARGLIGGVASEPALRAELEARSTSSLRAELEAVDPDAASRIERNDRVRTVRALEIERLTGEKMSEQHRAHAFGDAPFDVRWIVLDLERAALERRLRERVDAMFAAGLVEEVRSLYARGYGPELPPLRAIGYREVGELVAGRIDKAVARERMAVATRRLAKRQRTWFRAEPGAHWFDVADRASAFEAGLRALDAQTPPPQQR